MLVTAPPGGMMAGSKFPAASGGRPLALRAMGPASEVEPEVLTAMVNCAVAPALMVWAALLEGAKLKSAGVTAGPMVRARGVDWAERKSASPE